MAPQKYNSPIIQVIVKKINETVIYEYVKTQEYSL